MREQKGKGRKENIYFFREKKCGTISKHAKRPNNAKKANIVEATIVCRRLAEREAGGYNRVKRNTRQP